MQDIAEGHPGSRLSSDTATLFLTNLTGLQVRNDSFCHWLGMEDSHSWEYIEKGSPYVGVQLTYSNGEYCQVVVSDGLVTWLF